jgi:hypothetical protein
MTTTIGDAMDSVGDVFEPALPITKGAGPPLSVMASISEQDLNNASILADNGASTGDRIGNEDVCYVGNPVLTPVPAVLAQAGAMNAILIAMQFAKKQA